MDARRRRIPAAFVAAAVLAAAAALALARQPALAKAGPAARQFAPAQIARGRELASLGNCAVCHTAPGGRAYAGGRAIATPFGTVYGSNITPDPSTGIGGWSLADFRRAMREGVARGGRHLYPAFPYTHFTKLTDSDIAALYAFVMTRQPVAARTPPDRLRFPFGIRALMSMWNWLYLDDRRFVPDARHSAAWNRGAYLAEALAHCGACHTPRNFLGAEKRDRRFAGGEAEHWYAPPLDADSPSPNAWTADALDAYLRGKHAKGHGAAAGPMRAVVQQLAKADPADVHAISVYIASLMPKTGPGPVALRPFADTKVAAVFAGGCAPCHGGHGELALPHSAALSAATTLAETTPRNAIRILLYGLPWQTGRRAPFMPGYADSLTDKQAATLLNELRARYTRAQPWHDLENKVRAIRKEGPR